ncbi:MAG: DUF5659 domain-containing protein [Candidatus Paceibacterota bacterium]|jgi:hypothetical protein
MENENKKFLTRDFYITAFLIAKGYKVSDVDMTIPDKMFFSFEDFKGRERLVRDFLCGQASVEPQKFISGIKILKSLIHARD